METKSNAKDYVTKSGEASDAVALTAKAILEASRITNRWGYDIADLQAMARLWLLRGEIREFVEGAIGNAKTAITMDMRAGTTMLEDYFGIPDVKKMKALRAKINSLGE